MMKKNAQSILEYVILLIVVIVCLAAMRSYFRNSLSGKLRDAGDSIGQGEVYQPGKTITRYN
jgi:hypothetical protein